MKEHDAFLRRVAGPACLLLLLSAPTLAASLGKWQKKLDQAEARLASKDWQGTFGDSSALIRGLVDKNTLDPGATELAAQALVLQAIAEANLGMNEEAVWHWQAAGGMIDGLSELDLSDYGLAEALLKGSADREPDSSGGRGSGKGEYEKVVILRTVKPQAPKAVRKRFANGALTMEVVIDLSGRPSRPIVKSQGPVPMMVFPILDAVRQWRFTPASRDGEPLRVVYELKIDYL